MSAEFTVRKSPTHVGKHPREFLQLAALCPRQVNPAVTTVSAAMNDPVWYKYVEDAIIKANKSLLSRCRCRLNPISKTTLLSITIDCSSLITWRISFGQRSPYVEDSHGEQGRGFQGH